MGAKRRPTWQTALMWFGGGMAVTWLVAYFFDSRYGAARRQKAVDKALELRDKAAAG